MSYPNPMRNQNPMTSMYGSDDQRRRMMLANMLQQQQSNQQPQQSSVDGIPAATSPYQGLADGINNATQGYAYGGQGVGQDQGDGGQLNQGGSMGQPGDANMRGNIMQNYNAPGGGSQAGYQLSAPMSAQRGMMGSMSRFGDQLQSVASSLGKGASSLGSSAMSAMRSFRR